MRFISAEDCLDYAKPGHPESPQRVGATLKHLRAQDDLVLAWSKPSMNKVGAAVAAVHPETFLARLAEVDDFDGDTPAHPGIKEHALRSVSGALDAMRFAEEGEFAFSLLRPPGHHACPERAMGFCYLNQVAVCAVQAMSAGKRIAVLDFDVHHGNGTEMMLMGRGNCLYASVHQSPAYPGTGEMSRMNCRNFPVKPEASREDYADAMYRAFDAVVKFAPDIIAVSAGFDAFRGDPLAQENLEGEDYFAMGRKLRDVGIPVFSVLEGGYSKELPALIYEYLRGFSGC